MSALTRLLLFVYGIFVVAATGRSAYQLIAHPSRAPLAYGLSALAAVVYIVGFVLLFRNAHASARPGVRRAAWCWLGVEFTGVVVVGTLSLAVPSAFPDATIWSQYGSGYGWVPAVLPLLAALWLRRRGQHERPAQPVPGSSEGSEPLR